jgi:Ca2+/H+ antiporter, TMEM165/GDT1 family
MVFSINKANPGCVKNPIFDRPCSTIGALFSPQCRYPMEALISSTAAVAIAEIGDKTQLLTLFLISRYRKPWPIIAGVLLATLVNHGLSAWLGSWMAGFIPANWLPYMVSGSFFAVGLWLLVPDKDDEGSEQFGQYGAFIASLALFFLAEIGDKTQIATVILAAKYTSALQVVTGTTLGVLIANVPVIFAGDWIMARIPLAAARKMAFLLFMLLALLSLAGAALLP